MEKKELICIGCPLGCRLLVTIEDDQSMTVTGNTCPRGEQYAKKELTNPTRIVTTSLPVLDGHLMQVSCKTASDIPKGKIKDCMKAIKNVKVNAPIKIGDVLVVNVADTGVDLVATKNIMRKE